MAAALSLKVFQWISRGFQDISQPVSDPGGLSINPHAERGFPEDKGSEAGMRLMWVSHKLLLHPLFLGTTLGEKISHRTMDRGHEPMMWTGGPSMLLWVLPPGHDRNRSYVVDNLRNPKLQKVTALSCHVSLSVEIPKAHEGLPRRRSRIQCLPCNP